MSKRCGDPGAGNRDYFLQIIKSRCLPVRELSQANRIYFFSGFPPGRFTITFLGLAKVGFRKHQSSNLVQKLIECTNVQPSTKAPLLPNPCWWLAYFIQFQVKSLLVCFVRQYSIKKLSKEYYVLFL